MTFRLCCFVAVFLACAGCDRPENKPLFEFDLAEHYAVRISEDELQHLYADADHSRPAREKLTVIEGEIPETLRDTNVISTLEAIGYAKHRLSFEAMNRLRSIFVHRPSSTITSTTCMRVFRDILVFRLQGRISGIAKICFDCGASHLIGAKYPTNAFGMNGEYGQLRTLLYPEHHLTSYRSTAR